MSSYSPPMGPHLLRRTALLLMSTALINGVSDQRGAPTASSTQSGVCVAVTLPSVQGAVGSATEVASAVRDLFCNVLSGPSMHAVPIDSRLAAQAVEEAKQKSCSNVL